MISSVKAMRRGMVIRSLLVLSIFGVLTKLWDLVELVPAYKRLAEMFPYYVPKSLVNLLQVGLALFVTVLMFRTKLKSAFASFGLKASLETGFLVGGIAVFPLYAVFAFAMGFSPKESLGAILFLSVISPVAEEVIGRGFAFGLLRKLGWSFWPAALVPALVMASEHIEGDFSLGQAAAVFLITGIGFTAFSWFYERWGNNLWVPIALHMLMNLAWNLFSVGESAFAGWLPTIMQAATLILAVTLTLWRNRIPIATLHG
jgi:membrane protease YdiL (CAAX protease family)